MKTFTKSILLSALAGLMIASAANAHRITLYEDSYFGEKVLKPGEYKIAVDNGQAVISQGKTKLEAKVTVETADTRFLSTTVRYRNGDGKYRVQEIRLGGTRTKIVLN